MKRLWIDWSTGRLETQYKGAKTVRNWLESEVFSMMYRPGAVPLIPFLIGAGNKTVTEALVESTNVPLLSA